PARPPRLRRPTPGPPLDPPGQPRGRLRLPYRPPPPRRRAPQRLRIARRPTPGPPRPPPSPRLTTPRPKTSPLTQPRPLPRSSSPAQHSVGFVSAAGFSIGGVPHLTHLTVGFVSAARLHLPLLSQITQTPTRFGSKSS